MKTLALIVSLAAGTSFAAENAPPAKVTPVMTRDLEGIPGKEMLVLVVEYPPGGVSAPHRHDASVFVYVLEGAVTMQVAGSAPVTLKAGGSFYETPGDVHVTSANASSSEPAKFLVYMLKNKGAPPSTPVTGVQPGG
ncbi:MAG TPA: cupin domain-containing protein [Steroidobacteraceae bacterium]